MATRNRTPQAGGTTAIPDAMTIASSADALALPHDAAALAGALVLRDGTRLHQRAIRSDDAARLQAFHGRLSRKSVLFRFFGVMPVLNSDLAVRLSQVDYDNRMAVVATADGSADAPIIAVARYQRTGPEVAEIGLAVEDRWQGHGIGPRLLRTLAAYARRHGIAVLVADVMYDNDRMLAMLRHSGIPTTSHIRDGRVEARLDIAGFDGVDTRIGS